MYKTFPIVVIWDASDKIPSHICEEIKYKSLELTISFNPDFTLKSVALFDIILKSKLYNSVVDILLDNNLYNVK